ncbi:pentapeptide repeat-containing protein [Thalassospira xiamenensis]|uniref:Pentapeptide repeat-containing protein n=1 Tax=Thalassospira xiamenensis TaxID=220697 RepID=A0A285RN11_9PROT|nr:pentapeptide repeat-containing protein [Thalassospira xiamenensis]SOB93667.1 hypothetical protein SAMN05428964_101807 [Thalassospira xiamenensis]
MTEETEQERPTLGGEEAIKLWRQGREAWNNWIDQHSGWDIDFSFSDFSRELGRDEDISFSGYRFGNGNIYFFNANFSNNNINFSRAKFGNGRVDFSLAKFGNGEANFSGTIFGNGRVDFSDAIFGNGKVNFSGATFGDGGTHFYRTRFGKGYVDFSKAVFGNGGVTFFQSKFGDGKVDFSGVDFGNGDLNFSDANLGNGDVIFNEASFGCDNISFLRTTFGDGSVKFSRALIGKCNLNFFESDFGKGSLNFYNTMLGNSTISLNHTTIDVLTFKPRHFESKSIMGQGISIKSLAIFSLPTSANELKYFDLQGASFDGPLFLSANLNIIPDLRATRYSHQVDLSGLKVELPRTSIRFGWPPKLVRKAEDPQDGPKLRRLKEIAETNKDHQAALRFSADENRAKRWIETSWFGSVLDMAFSFFSNYGQSILRPFVCLLAIFADWTSIYLALSPRTLANWWAGLEQAALLSVSNSLPFLPQSRDLRTDALTALYGTTDPSLCVDLLMITQGVLSFVFLFLIGLGLRNRFRL